MTARDFVYWLQGHMEINDPKTIDKAQLEIIKEHLRLVFEKEKQAAKPRTGGGIASALSGMGGIAGTWAGSSMGGDTQAFC